MYLPKFNCSAKIKLLIIATITVLKGPKAVTKTGPFALIINPET